METKKAWAKGANLGQIAWEQKTIKLYGKEHNVPRLTAWYGTQSYQYSGTDNQAQPMTEELQAILSRVNELLGTDFNAILCNKYRDGQDSVSWHCDDEPEIDQSQGIASISFGASRDFLTKRKDGSDRQKVTIEDGDLLYMPPGFQDTHLHCVPKRKRVNGERINLTFRKQL